MWRKLNVKRGKVIKKKRAWSSQKSNQDKHTKEDVDMELLKTAKSIAEGLQADQRTVTEVEDEELFYFKSLATTMKSLDPQSKAYVRMQIEQLMFQVQFGGQVSNSSLPIARNRGHFAPAFIGQWSMLYCSGIKTKWMLGLRRDRGRDKFDTKYWTI